MFCTNVRKISPVTEPNCTSKNTVLPLYPWLLPTKLCLPNIISIQLADCKALFTHIFHVYLILKRLNECQGMSWEYKTKQRADKLIWAFHRVTKISLLPSDILVDICGFWFGSIKNRMLCFQGISGLMFSLLIL